MGLDVNLTKQDNSTNVSITKGATQKSINDALVSAKAYRDEAEVSKNSAVQSANNSASSATSSSTSATSANNSATIATTQASIATSQASIATTKANEATTSANNASTSETNALESANTATTKASEASISASTATTQATLATTKASEASASASNASASASTATTQATLAIDTVSIITGMTVATGDEGTQASWDGANGILTVPKGDTGPQGIQGVAGNDGTSITSVTSNKVGTTTTVTVNGDFTNAPYNFDIEDGVTPELATVATTGSYTDLINKPTIPTGLSASNVLLNQSSLALDDFAVTKNFATVTYTGNGTTQSITTGISSVDFTVASNGSGYYHDRTAGDCIVKNDAGTIIESGSCVCNVSKVHIKSRSDATDNYVFDGLRGVTEGIRTNVTSGTNIEAGSVVGFALNSITLGNFIYTNGSGKTYVAYQTLYTHIKWGLTNQNKRYIEAYNPITGDVMEMYQGSGIAGHQILHSLGRELDLLHIKNLDGTNNWFTLGSALGEDKYLQLNTTIALSTGGTQVISKDNISISDTGGNLNASGNSYILYGKAKSQNWTIVQYQGTGASGNFVETKDVNGVARRPARITFKSISTGGTYYDWAVVDNKRDSFDFVALNLSNAEYTGYSGDYIKPNGFEPIDNAARWNASGVQYIALVEFDTNGDGGDGYFNLPTDDSVLNVTSGKFTSTNGLNDSGYDVALETVTGSIDFSTATDGINYVAKQLGGGYQFYNKRPMNGLYTKESADDNRLVFDKETGKYWTTTGGELVTNGTFDSDTSGWAGTTGITLSVVSGNLKVLAGTTDYQGAYQSVTTVVGKRYKLSFDLNYQTALCGVQVGTSPLDHSLYAKSALSNGSYSIEFIAETTSTFITFAHNTNTDGAYFYLDNISVYKAEPTLDQPLSTPISFLPYPWMVASSTPQYEIRPRVDRIRR